MTGSVLTRASYQWSTRPADERFLTDEDLYANALHSMETSREIVLPVNEYKVFPLEDGDLKILHRMQDDSDKQFTNFSFKQLATIVGAPANDLTEIPNTLAQLRLQYGIDNYLGMAKVLYGENSVRAFTRTTYGRIWDAPVIKAVMDMNQDGLWKVPAASYSNVDPLRATTLYRSDRDMFMFKVDPEHAIEIDGETLFRGFMVWNTEVGNGTTFGLSTFLYRYVCDNRMVWGARDVQEVVLRHTKNGPMRFAQYVGPALEAYSNSSTENIVRGVKVAKTLKVGDNTEEVTQWLRKQGFQLQVAKKAVEKAEEEEGDPTNAWAALNGVTAYARGLKYSDTRVAIERQAGEVMEKLAA